MTKQKNTGKTLYSLVPLQDFKNILGYDNRDDNLSLFCLTTATHTIEQHCRRRLLAKRHFETLPFWGDQVIPLTHYPIIEMLAVYLWDKRIVEPDLYHVVPDITAGLDVPASLVLSPAVRPVRGELSIKAVYRAGYPAGKVPADLASACIELAAWNFARYKGRKIGITGNLRGNGERLEMAMPENVRLLLEGYRRKLV
jgi:hypothetical protein